MFKKLYCLIQYELESEESESGKVERVATADFCFKIISCIHPAKISFYHSLISYNHLGTVSTILPDNRVQFVVILFYDHGCTGHFDFIFYYLSNIGLHNSYYYHLLYNRNECLECIQMYR